MIRPWAAGLIGVIAGPVVLTQIALWDHVRRYQTGSEFWAGFITVPVGIVSGALCGALLAWIARRKPGSYWWLSAPLGFLATHALLYGALMLVVRLAGSGL